MDWQVSPALIVYELPVQVGVIVAVVVVGELSLVSKRPEHPTKWTGLAL
jgi:hypothetical protein